ncbi:MAG: hypothetical protein FJ128_09175 [Deltaproteobacteria bacterium]|nr:hypothetical protein [Deltaproteobacteria bacterium]
MNLLAALLSLTLLALAGCRTLPPPVTPALDSPEAVLTRLKARQLDVKTFEAKGRLTLMAPQRNVSGTGLLKASFPSSLRVDLLDLLGRAALLFFSDGREVQVLFPRDGKLLQGDATPANLAAFLPPGVTLPQVLRLLTGSLPFSQDAAGRMRRETDAYVLEWLNPDGSLKERLWVSVQEGTPVKLEWYETDGRLRFTAELGDFGPLGPAQPRTITVRTTQPAVELRLTLREMHRNVPVTEADLALPRLPGVVTVPLGR